MSSPPRPKSLQSPLVYDPPTGPLNILHRDDHILVLSKPPKLLSVPGRDPAHRDSLQTRAQEEFPDALLVHRLDMETSGIMIMALTKKAQANLGRQFEERRVEKTYIARVWGRVEGARGTIDLPLRCDWPNRPLQMVCHEHGKPAQTGWEVLERGETSTLMKLTPHTGRSHQLRVHMLHLNTCLPRESGDLSPPEKDSRLRGKSTFEGHPILGDDFYAPEDALNAAPRLCLHAQRLKLFHPESGAKIEFTDEITL